jgi:hypothetical protein
MASIAPQVNISVLSRMDNRTPQLTLVHWATALLRAPTRGDFHDGTAGATDMDSERFDLLSRAIGRRGLLASTLAFSSSCFAPALASAGSAACQKRGAGVRCRNNGQCCSGRCRKRPRTRKGKCRCSQLQQPCGDNFDCCGHQEGVAETPTCSDLFNVCCMNPGQPCSNSGDCCGLAIICSDAKICEHV